MNYIALSQSGLLQHRAQTLVNRLASCTICPRHCHVDRKNDESSGFCKTGRMPVVSSTVAHFGEEPALVGTKGAGNIFFGQCNLKCVYCQNWQISQAGKRQNEISASDLADRMISLQDQGCHNINFVSPSHFVAQLVEAVDIAARKGLKIPLVYNTNAYDDLETLKMLDGIIDIYLPDIKYADDLDAVKYSQGQNYKQISRIAIKEMFRQVGQLECDENGLAKRGLIVRHLILPNDISGTEDCFKFLSHELSPEVTVSLMAQYYPTNKAERVPLLSRKIRLREYEKAVDLLDKYGLVNGWVQEMEATEVYRPDFEREKPFNNKEIGLNF